MRIKLLLFLLGFQLLASAQENVLKGKIVDTEGEALIGVTILEKGTQNGTITDIDGSYTLRLTTENPVVVCTYIGFKTIEATVNKNTVLDFAMELDVETLDEVVITAMGVEKSKKALTFAQQRISAETMMEAPENNFTSMLTGKVAGIQVVAPPNPTGSSRVIIRGNSSITQNNQPLFVVDGVPIDNAGTNLGSQSAGIDYGNNAADIDPNTIEDIQVLKGPNAAALYGSRAQNGAIIITTRKGSSKDGLKVTYSANVSGQRIFEYPALQNMYGFGNVDRIDGVDANEIPDSNATGAHDRSYGPLMNGFLYINLQGDTIPMTPQPNNVRDFYQTAFFLRNNLSIEGGSDNARLIANYSHYRGNTIVPNMNKQTKQTFNIRGILTPAKALTLDTRIQYQLNVAENRQKNNGNPRNPLYYWAEMPRNVRLQDLLPYKDEDGVEIAAQNNNEFKNPYWSIYEDPNEDRRDRVTGFLNVKYDIADWLTFASQASMDVIFHNGWEAGDIGATNDRNGSYMEFQNFRLETNVEARLIASKTFNKFGISFIGAVNNSDRQVDNHRANIVSLIEPKFYSLTNTVEGVETTLNQTRQVINSVWSSTDFSYDDFLFLTVRGRNDWSSTLPADNRSFFYPSAGLSFVPTSIFTLPRQINFLKVRADWAKVGNDPGPYNLTDTYQFNVGEFTGLTTANNTDNNNANNSNTNRIKRNPDFRPEQTTSWEVGAEISLFNDRVTLDATYYKTNTVDQILRATLTSASGFDSKWVNGGEVQNSGIEISGTIRLVDDPRFSWDLIGNYAKNNSLVLSLNEEDVEEFVLNSWGGENFLYVSATVGEPYGTMRGRVWETTDEGVRIVQGPTETNPGQPVETTESYAIGNSNPDWLGSITNSFRYKNFTLGVMVDIKWGGDIKSQTTQLAWTNGNLVQSLEYREDYWLSNYVYREDRVAQELTRGVLHDDAVYRVLDEDGNQVLDENNKPVYEQNTDLYYTPSAWHKQWVANLHERTIYDATSVKLREVTLNYGFPRQIMDVLPFKQMSIGLFGRNLWLIHHNTPQGLDPEASVDNSNGQGIEMGSQPFSGTFGGNIRIVF